MALQTFYKEKQRQNWLVLNISNSPITIGDLKKLPSIAVGKRIDILQYYTPQQAGQSVDLKYCLDNNYLSLDEIQDIGSPQTPKTSDDITPASLGDTTGGGGGGGGGGGSSTIIGNEATGTNGIDVAIGDAANGSNYGAAVGYGSSGSYYGASVGYGSNGSYYGAAVGYNSSGNNQGASVGYYSNGSYYGTSVGAYSKGGNGGVAIGNGTGNNIEGRIEIGGFKPSTFQTVSRISSDATGMTSFSVGYIAPTDAMAGIANFSNADGTLPQGMLGFYQDAGIPKVAYNNAGTVTSYDFGGGGISTIIGTGATGTNGQDVAIGDYADSYNYGTSVGYQSNSYHRGVSVGTLSNGSYFGTSVGHQSNGSNYGTSVGNQSNGSNYGTSVGNGAKGGNGGVAIGLGTGNNIEGRIEIGGFKPSTSQTVSRISSDATGMTSFTVGSAVPTDSSNSTYFFDNADGTLPRGMLGFSIVGGNLVVAYNDAGTIKTGTVVLT